MKRPSPATIIAMLALFLAGGGTALAGSPLLITSKSQIKPSVVKELRGVRGPQGPRGEPAWPLIRGEQGLSGKEGPTGATGQSIVGPEGRRGATGPPGAALGTLSTRTESATIPPGIGTVEAKCHVGEEFIGSAGVWTIPFVPVQEREVDGAIVGYVDNTSGEPVKAFAAARCAGP